MEHSPCLVTWPTDATAGDLMADYLRPSHHCQLPASHVHEPEQPAGGVLNAGPVPHRCHCGSWAPVRDVEPARS
jgi:hypothetical protein